MADDRGIPPNPGQNGGWSNVPSHGNPGAPQPGSQAYPPQPQAAYPPPPGYGSAPPPPGAYPPQQFPPPPPYGAAPQAMQGYEQPVARAASSKLPWILGIGAVVVVGGFVVLVGVVWALGGMSRSSSGGSSSSMLSFGDSNPLIGTWKLVQGDPAGCGEVTFTADTETDSYPNQAATSHRVTYNVSPDRVYVMGNTGVPGAVRYNIASHDKIVLDTWANCAWERAD